MEPEQLQNFNERLSQWVANQGFWFQVRYSMAGSGMGGRAMFHLMRLGYRLLIFLLIVAVGFWIFLVKRTDSARFNEALRKDLQTGLTASDLDMRGFNRLQGQLEISRLAAEGGTDTFFTALEARNIRCKMGLLDGLAGIWKPGIISMARVDIDLRAGADDGESAQKLADSLFRKPDAIAANAFEASDATIRWGYSERTQGAIESSDMKMQRTDTGWRISLKGGKFSQNWLRRMDIVNLVVECNPDGLVFEKAELKQGNGTVDFSGLRLDGGERPQLDGVAKIKNLVLEEIIPPALRSFVEGSISGDFRVFGSTNTSTGIGFEGQVVLDSQLDQDGKDVVKDVITLRERLHLLGALSVVDFSRNYHRVDFIEGSFQMKTIGGGMEVSDVKLQSKDDLLNLEGKMSVRLPTDEEIKAALAQGSGTGASPLFQGDDEGSADKEISKSESDFTLKRAAQEAKRVKEGLQSVDSLTLFDRLGLSIEMRRLQNQASERMSRMLRYDGLFRISIPGDAFDRSNRLRQLYPADAATGRINMRVPIEGYLYELTLKQAEDIYQQRQN